MNEKPIERVIEWAGSQAALAKLCNVSRGAVHLWTKEGIPARRAIQIEELSGGKIRASDLCDWRDDQAA